MPEYNSQIKTSRIPILGLLAEQVTAFPGSPVEGLLVHRTDLKQIYAYLNSAWMALDNTNVSVVGHTHAQSDITGLVAALAGKVDTTRTLTAGTGLTGGGDLSANRTFAVNFAADGAGTANTAVVATDQRLSNSRSPNGAASGDLTGSYPNPTVAAGAVNLAKLGANVKAILDGGSATATEPALRQLGTSAGMAFPGNGRLDQLNAAGAAINLGGYVINAVGTPVSATDAANKGYVDAKLTGIEWKESVKAASTVTQTLTGLADPITVDGVSISSTTSDRVLLKNQSNPVENGIYIKGGSSLLRALDSDGTGELSPSAAVFVEQGTLQADTGWTISTDGTITIGTTAINWIQFTGVGSFLSGGGLTKTGNSIDIVAADGSIVVNPDSITVGLVPVTKGGTGAITAGGGLNALGGTKTATVAVPALTAGTWTAVVFGTLNFAPGWTANIDRISDGQQMILDIRYVSANVLEVRADIAVAGSTLEITATGSAA